jgi:hypothetical protein
LWIKTKVQKVEKWEQREEEGEGLGGGNVERDEVGRDSGLPAMYAPSLSLSL